MANQTVTKVPDYIMWGGNWTNVSVASRRVELPIQGLAYYKVQLAQPSAVTTCSIKETFIPAQSYWTGTEVVGCTAAGFNGSTRVWGVEQSFNYDITRQTDHTFTFSGLTGNVDSIEFSIYYAGDIQGLQELWTYATAPTASYTYNVPTLGLTVQPSNAYIGDRITGSIENPFDQTFNVRFLYNSTLLESFSTTSSTFSTLASDSWFTTAGVTGNSMNVTVSISDGIGRTATARVTVQKRTARVPSITAPKGGTLDGGSDITFIWSSSGEGTQERAELEYATGGEWSALATMYEAESFTVYAAYFPPGSVSWRIRILNNYGIWSDWVQASFSVSYSAVSQTVAVNSPTSGIINTASNKTFTVALQASAPVYAPFTVASATFFWRSGETGAFTEVAMTPNGNTASVTIPGGTIPSGRMEWHASATDNTGRTTETPHYVLTAMQADVEAAPLSPWNTIESGSGPIPFRWAFGSLDGSPQGRAQLQYSTDGTAWLDENIFADVSGDGTSYTAPAAAFPGGTVYWRVRAYNEAGTAGAWSEAASFTVYAAPQVLGVTGDGKPFLTVTWQTTGQEAFEMEVNGKTYGPYFGADVRSYTLPEPLADGTYTARVRAQNRYGLWSEWASGEVSVTNVPGPTFILFSDDGVNAHLRTMGATLAPTITRQPQDAQGTSGTVTISIASYPTGGPPEYAPAPSKRWYYRDPGGAWTEITGSSGAGSRLNITCAQNIDGRQYRCRLYNAVGEVYSRVVTYHYAAPNMLIGTPITGKFRQGTGYFLVYRDDELIGKTYEYEFTDRAALGEHTYRFLQVLPGGYYSEDTVKATSSVSCPMIAPLEGGAFLELRLSENDDREIQVTESQEVVFTQYAGAEYPSAEIGEARSKSVSLDVSALMSDEDFAAAFKALLGRDVIVKTPGGEVVVGPLPGYNRRDRSSHRAWTFTITQEDWRDFVDES